MDVQIVRNKFEFFSFIKKHPVLSLFIAYFFFCSATFANMYKMSLSGVLAIAIAVVALYACLGYKIAQSQDVKGVNKTAIIGGFTLVSAFLMYVFCRNIALERYDIAFRFAFIAVLLFLLTVVVVEICQKTFSYESAVVIIFIIAYLLRLFYVLYTGYRTRQHDLYVNGKVGHYYYIKYIYENFSLPKENILYSQMYHPPFHHIVCASVLRFWTGLGVDYTVAFEGLQMLTMTQSMFTLLFCYGILKEINLKGNGLLVSLAILAVHPTFIILSGSLNNDNASVMLAIMALYFTVKWYKSKKPVHIIGIALGVGLGMMTKLSVWMVAPPIAVVFLYALIKNTDKTALIKQFAVFAVICVPLGLFWSVRNYILCDMPFGYVLEQTVSSPQYVGNYTIADRLFNFKLYQLSSVFTQNKVINPDALYNDFNPTIGILKAGMFEESLFPNIEGICTVAFYASVVLALISVISAVVVFVFDKSREGVIRLFLGLTTLIVMVSFYAFCLMYPHVCTMSARYAVPAITVNIFAIGLLVEKLERMKKAKAGKVLSYIIIGITVIFVLSSAGVYTAIPFN